ncbi:hypothetical protein F4813DRAFT_391360 [Daldinia decipiens]|uniref:uncharacterized protein n=1 Tax=Daldinia decipiens TaxID=326647 RepID=UPI0020C2F4E0|nr:uncharacterized protein F4813DRAFT_391360 [Daldinia decipiens]KAI1655785.1 hypothetical protein F4813DRAFT_391360 [Daldinia decipiens]
MSSSHVYTVPGAYGQPIPWYMLSPDNTMHRPFGAFSRGHAVAPRPFIFGVPPEELARRRADAAFEERMAQLARSPGQPAPAPRRPFPEPQMPVLGRAVLRVGAALGRCAARVRAWSAWGARTSEQVKQDYARVMFVAERKYWLALTAYRKSPWPNTLRQLWYLLLMLLGLVLVVWVGWLKILAVMEERGRREVYLRGIPEYRVWSVTQPRCTG